MADEIRGEEIERKWNPKKPFVIPEEQIVFLKMFVVSVHKFHLDIETSLGGSLELHQITHLRKKREGKRLNLWVAGEMGLSFSGKEMK